MKLNSAKYNRIEAEVLNQINLITIRLPDGSVHHLEGVAPTGSTIAFFCTDIINNRILGFDGEVEIVFVPSLTSKTEPLPSVFSEQETITWEPK